MECHTMLGRRRETVNEPQAPLAMRPEEGRIPGRAMMLIETVTSSNQLLMPIPTAEIQVNTNPGMYQNPGY